MFPQPLINLGMAIHEKMLSHLRDNFVTVIDFVLTVVKNSSANMLHFPLSTFCNLQTSMTKALKWLQHHSNLFGQHKHAIQQPRSQGFSLFVIGKSGKGPGTGRSHDFQHPDIVGVNKL